MCQPPHSPLSQPRDKVPTLPIRTLLGPHAPIPAGTAIPSFGMGHSIPWWLHPASSPWKGQKGTFNPSPQAGLQRGTSPQQWGCFVHGHIKVCRTDELTSKQQGRTLNISPCLLHTEAFSHSFFPVLNTPNSFPSVILSGIFFSFLQVIRANSISNPPPKHPLHPPSIASCFHVSQASPENLCWMCLLHELLITAHGIELLENPSTHSGRISHFLICL